MIQRHLAERNRVPQSFISKDESGDQEITLKTLRKIFNALSYDLVVIPVAQEPFDTVLEKRTLKYATRNLEYVKGTMSLEKQLPDKRFTDALLEEEVKRLIYSGTTKIWDLP